MLTGDALLSVIDAAAVRAGNEALKDSLIEFDAAIDWGCDLNDCGQGWCGEMKDDNVSILTPGTEDKSVCFHELDHFFDLHFPSS
jgi:hypothetical protein